MEKKRMTKAEAIDLLKNRKVYVNGKSREIQEKLFELGWKWNNGDQKVSCKDSPFLYIYENMTITKGEDMNLFMEHCHTEISYEEIISIEVKPDCPFKPFDRVLVRDADNEGWKPAFFWKKVNDNHYPYIETLGGGFKQCIPYEGHEHFIDTTKSPEHEK